MSLLGVCWLLDTRAVCRCFKSAHVWLQLLLWCLAAGFPPALPVTDGQVLQQHEYTALVFGVSSSSTTVTADDVASV